MNVVNLLVNLPYPCYPCESLGIKCEPLCCIKTLLTGSELTKFEDFFLKYNCDIYALRSAAKKIPAHLRDR